VQFKSAGRGKSAWGRGEMRPGGLCPGRTKGGIEGVKSVKIKADSSALDQGTLSPILSYGTFPLHMLMTSLTILL